MGNLETGKFIHENNPDRTPNHAVRGEFLQSEEWRKFQESVGRKTHNIKGENFNASIIGHRLPVVGEYFYVPRGPIITHNLQLTTHNPILELLELARKENVGWIRFDANSQEILEIIKNTVGADLVSAQKGQTLCLSLQKYKIVKAPHDMQPREILMVDITKSEEELLAQMKTKTRYNIKLSQKRGVSVKVISNFQFPISNKISNDRNSKFYIDKFIELIKITARRDNITPHPESYYRKMFEIIPPENLKLYVAEYNDKVIAANIVIFYGNTATYLHGASDNKYRNVMAPYLLQWQAIMDAKKMGCTRYDLGGVKILKPETRNPKPNWFKKVTGYKLQVTRNGWQGITRFKAGFAPDIKPIVFPGSYDIILNSSKYKLYKILQIIKNIIT